MPTNPEALSQKTQLPKQTTQQPKTQEETAKATKANWN
jgi:hypothetical protein